MTSSTIKICILFDFAIGPSGGGNNFLKNLKRYLQSIEAYEEDPQRADVILFNSHHSIKAVAKIKYKYPDKVFIHRIDGPMRLYNTRTDRRDSIVYAANKYITNATIFQSNWSCFENHRLGLEEKKYEAVILNAPNPSIFNRENKKPFLPENKIHLIASCWSSNWNKGFEAYQWLDDNLNFDKYEMLLVGKSPIAFRNIKCLSPQNSSMLAEKLKESDIFIFASKAESCSNSLLEALHCGLPVVGFCGSSNPEIIADGGELFTYPSDIPNLLEKISKDYKSYQNNIKNPSIQVVGKQYYDFIRQVSYEISLIKQGEKQFSRIDYLILQITILYNKLLTHLMGILKRLLS